MSFNHYLSNQAKKRVDFSNKVQNNQFNIEGHCECCHETRMIGEVLDKYTSCAVYVCKDCFKNESDLVLSVDECEIEF